ncbi:MAG: hypothetical protein U0Q16_16025 [Bryobacteraceae bacterium]
MTRILIAVLVVSLCCAQPVIRQNGVQSAGAFGGFSSVAPGSWIEIFGSNLANSTRPWAGSDFNGTTAPTALDGTRVTIGGQPAFIAYISPTQVNAQVPTGINQGPQQLVVTTPQGSSAAHVLSVNSVQPGLLAPSSFAVAGRQQAVALFPDGGTYVLPPGSIPGVPSKRAQPGDTITLYGVGFGPVTPNVPAGQTTQQSNSLAQTFQLNIGGAPAVVKYAGLAPNTVGLYQFNVVVPNITSSDSAAVTLTLNGVPGLQTLYLAVGSGSAAGPTLSSLSFSSTTVIGGNKLLGTVTLSQPAPLGGGALVSLSSSSGSVSVPPTVVIGDGATSVTFDVSTSAVVSAQDVVVTANYAGSPVQGRLTVTPPANSGFPAFSSLTATSDVESDRQTGFHVQIGLGNIGGNPVSCQGGAGSSLLSGVAYWTSYSVKDLTVTCSGTPMPGLSPMIDYTKGTTAQVTSATLTFTLSPQGPPTSGRFSGTIELVSSIGKINTPFSGTYTAN